MAEGEAHSGVQLTLYRPFSAIFEEVVEKYIFHDIM